MKRLMNKKERDNFQGKNLVIKWTVSKGQDTYGYNICSLWINGEKKYSTCGGGYDMYGTVLGNFIQDRFYNELKRMDKRKFYGLFFVGKRNKRTKKRRYTNTFSKDGRLYLDGACGDDCMQKILKVIGFKLIPAHLQCKGDASDRAYYLESL
jgi:hypothetical protein